jgi:hypothetical protein
MTVRRWEKLIEQSDFRLDRYELVPIRRLRRFHNRITREFFTSIIRARLIPKQKSTDRIIPAVEAAARKASPVLGR